MNTRRGFLSTLFGVATIGAVSEAQKEEPVPPKYRVYFTTNDGKLKAVTVDGNIETVYDGSQGRPQQISAVRE